jgi:hypothetical protein
MQRFPSVSSSTWHIHVHTLTWRWKLCVLLIHAHREREPVQRRMCGFNHPNTELFTVLRAPRLDCGQKSDQADFFCCANKWHNQPGSWRSVITFTHTHIYIYIYIYHHLLFCAETSTTLLCLDSNTEFIWILIYCTIAETRRNCSEDL